MRPASDPPANTTAVQLMDRLGLLDSLTVFLAFHFFTLKNTDVLADRQRLDSQAGCLR